MRSHKGYYRPVNPKKYAGDPKTIIYRSHIEKKFMIQCDNNPNITRWASEELAIKYYNPIDKKLHRYFPDFLVRTKLGKTLVIEIKPYRQCFPPKPGKRKSKRFLNEQLEYIKNQAKWQAARKYCEEQGTEFKVITEKDIGIY